MTKRVKCISPHGGAHHGMLHNGTVVLPRPVLEADEHGNPVVVDSYLPEIPAEHYRLPPHEGGYVSNAVLGTVGYGQIVDAPDDFACDGFHFEDVDDAPPPSNPAAVPPSPAAQPSKE